MVTVDRTSKNTQKSMAYLAYRFFIESPYKIFDDFTTSFVQKHFFFQSQEKTISLGHYGRFIIEVGIVMLIILSKTK